MSQINGSTDGLFLYVEAGEDADVDELDQLSRQLRTELEDLDVGEVSLVEQGEIPAGAKSAEAVTWGALAITVLPTLLPKLVEFLQSWVMRAEDRKVKIKTVTGDQTVEIEYPTKGVSAQDLERLVKAMTGGQAELPEQGEQLEKEEQPADEVKSEEEEKPEEEEESEEQEQSAQESKLEEQKEPEVKEQPPTEEQGE
jgi:hypothetical protein